MGNSKIDLQNVWDDFCSNMDEYDEELEGWLGKIQYEIVMKAFLSSNVPYAKSEQDLKDMLNYFASEMIDNMYNL